MAGRFSIKIYDENNMQIPMEEAVRDRGAELYEFNFECAVSIDKTTGKITGHREYQPLEIIKPICKSSPVIYKKLCEGKKLKKIIIFLYRHDPEEGEETNFYQYVLEDVSIVSQKPMVLDTNSPNSKHLPPLERIAFIAEIIMQKYVRGNIEHTDKYKYKKQD